MAIAQSVTRARVHIITNDRAAIEIAQHLAVEFVVGAAERDRNRQLSHAERDRL